jgi:hypothetical protein
MFHGGGPNGRHSQGATKADLASFQLGGKGSFGYPSGGRSQMYGHPERTPPPPPPKYPIEDLQLEPQGNVRPQLNFICNNPPVAVTARHPLAKGIEMNSVGPLLETWDTLNVYCEVFELDSFTLDDHIEALSIASETVYCQLFNEIHCAVLKVLVSSEADGGKVWFQLPELEEGEEEEEEPEEEPTPEPEPQPAGRATRSSLAKAEADRLAAEAAAAEKQAAEPVLKHRAADLDAQFDWLDELRKRNFEHGGWETIVVGLLARLALDPRHQERCEGLLAALVPLDVEATQETVRQHYARLDINVRVQILQLLCILTADTRPIRQYMEECSETMTELRKKKIDFQRQRKAA